MSDNESKKSDYECKKCGKTFKSEKWYVNHLHKDVPCDYKCAKCGKQLSKKGYFLHRETCTGEDSSQTTNNVNNIDASKIDNSTHSTNNTNNALTNVNNANMVFLNPYGLEHKMMFKEQKYREELLGDAKDKILGIVRARNFLLAYQTLFNHIHGNLERPEHHNIFLNDRDKDEVCLFTGKQFAVNAAEEETPPLYRYLMIELKWVVGSADIPFDEKDQLLHDIQCHWRLVNESTDEDIRRMLFNNKPIVEHTINNNRVKPNTKLLEDFYKIERGSLKTYDVDVNLPK